MKMKIYTKFEQEITCQLKIDTSNWTDLDLSTWKFGKIIILMGFFWTKYIIFDVKKCRWVMFGRTEYWWNIWRKTDLLFQKWHEEFSKFSPEHIWRSKNWNFNGILLFKVENIWAENLHVMSMKNDAKLEEELTCQFIIDMRHLTNFVLSTQKFAL